MSSIDFIASEVDFTFASSFATTASAAFAFAASRLGWSPSPFGIGFHRRDFRYQALAGNRPETGNQVAVVVVGSILRR